MLAVLAQTLDVYIAAGCIVEGYAFFLRKGKASLLFFANLFLRPRYFLGQRQLSLAGATGNAIDVVLNENIGQSVGDPLGQHRIGVNVFNVHQVGAEYRIDGFVGRNRIFIRLELGQLFRCELLVSRLFFV